MDLNLPKQLAPLCERGYLKLNPGSFNAKARKSEATECIKSTVFHMFSFCDFCSDVFDVVEATCSVQTCQTQFLDVHCGFGFLFLVCVICEGMFRVYIFIYPTYDTYALA